MSGAKRKSEAGPSSSSGGDSAGGGGSSKRAKAVIQDLKRLECPICLEFPRAEVYQCSKGHSVCSLCVEKLTTCPSCQAPYETGSGGGKVRSHFAEDILDAMLFDCSWRKQGCKQEGLSRQQLSEHEGKCEHNPNWIKLCQMLFPNRRCAYKVAPTLLRNPIQDMPADFQEHLLNSHKMKLKESFIGVRYCETEEAVFVTNRGPFVYGNVLQLKTSQRFPGSLGYFVVFSYRDDSVADPKLSWFVVRITDKPQRSSVSVKFTLKSYTPPAPSNAASDVPNTEISWNGRIMGLTEFHEFRSTADGERDKFKYSLPLLHLQEYYLNADGRLKIYYEFAVNPTN